MLAPTAGRATLDELKLALARTAGEPTDAPSVPLPTGLVELDAPLGGGLRRGRVHELSGARSSGKATLALMAAAHATAAGQLVAWVDGPGELYPPAAAAAGVELSRLLIVRPTGKDAGLAAARAGEILARSRAFTLVVLDLPPGTSVPDRAATRLRQAAHETGAALVALATRPGSVPNAGLALEVRAEPGTPGPRRFAIAARRGQPMQTSVTIGAEQGFRAREQQLELLAAAAAIRPVRVPR